MSLEQANFLVTILGGYAAIGVVFAIPFIIFGLGRIDPAAKSMSLRVRLLVFSGCALLWPVMLQKWLTQKSPPLS